MRNATRRKQNIWFVFRERDDSGIEPTYTFSKPVKKRFSVSATSGTPQEDNYGLMPDYSRYAICYDKKFNPPEGTYVYVDRVPELDENKMLKVNERNEPTVKPDYIVQRMGYTKMSTITRIGLAKVTGDE